MTSLTLVLMRHAKAEQQGPPTQGDHGRPLAPRGFSDAAVAGVRLREWGPMPDLVLCSTSVRTAQTWDALTHGADEGDRVSGAGSSRPMAEVEVWHDRRIYNASPRALLEVLADVPDDVGVVAMVGHAPGIPALVSTLLGDHDHMSPATENLLLSFATMTTAVLHSDQRADVPEPASMSLVRAYGSRG
ncbi:MAG: histidine phosphatase family protein [Ornithinimicrobium sp.]